MTKYRGPQHPMPFPGHRTMAEVFVVDTSGKANRFGCPVERVAFAAALNARRQVRGWSYEKLANICGIDCSQTVKWLTGKKRGSWPNLYLISQALDRGEQKDMQA